jgi:transcriptional regulator GlxA family with amidase domain
VNEIVDLVNSNPLIFHNKDMIRGMEWSLLDSQMLVLSNTLYSADKNADRGKKSHESIIRQSIEFLKSNSYEPIHVLDLCSALNVGMRTMYHAFREFYGISPIRYLRLLRYAKARRDLINADPERTTVTDIAAKWHFWHFGRFSVEYKSLYGESPSETLSKGMGI